MTDQPTASRGAVDREPDPAAALISVCAAQGITVAVAESLTAGLVAASLGGVPGASAVFRGGVVAYATEVKASVLGVSRELLAEQGPVCGEVAEAMAVGVRSVCDADVGLATTGVAGPGAHYGKPAGTVFIGWAVAGRQFHRLLRFSGTRHEVRHAASMECLRYVLHSVKHSSCEQ